MILSVYIKGLLNGKEVDPTTILQLYENLTKHEIESTQVFVYDGDYFKFLDPSGFLCNPISYPSTGVSCEVEPYRNGEKSLHIPLPNSTQQSIRNAIDTFLNPLEIGEHHTTLINLGFE